jgi:hypothetical protein
VTGVAGIVGSTGATAATFGTAYGYFTYSGATAVGASGPIPFSTTVINSGVTNSGGTITVPNTGIYQVTVGITSDVTGPSAISTFALYLNNALFLGNGYISPSLYYAGTRLATQVLSDPGYRKYRVGMVSLSMTLALSAGDQLNIVNVSSGLRTLYPSAGFYGVGGPGAYITVIQIN